MSNKLALFLPPPCGIKLKYHKKKSTGSKVAKVFNFDETPLECLCFNDTGSSKTSLVPKRPLQTITTNLAPNNVEILLPKKKMLFFGDPYTRSIRYSDKIST